MLDELKQRISEGILEGANLLVSVKKEKMLELAAEKVDKAASSPEITWVLEKTMDHGCFLPLLVPGLRLLHEPGPEHPSPPNHHT